MECGIVYVKVVFPKGHKLEWLRYCALTDILPNNIKDKIRNLSDKINLNFKDDILIKMDNKINAGCVSSVDHIEEISNAIYNGFNEIFHKDGVECIRCVYTVGDIPKSELDRCKSLHEVDSLPPIIKLGTFLDSSTTPGIFKI